MRDVFELNEFFIEGKKSANTHVLLHISEPGTREHQKGYFFALCQIHESTPEAIELLQSLINTIEQNYYDKKNVASEEDPFENTIRFMNRRSEKLLDHDGELDIFLGVARGKELLFTTHGYPLAEVFYKKGENWESIDLVEESDEESQQLFASVSQGTISVGDSVFIATANIGNHFSTNRLKKLFSTRSSREISKHIERTITALKEETPSGGLLLYRPHEQEVPKTGRQVKHTERGSAESITELAANQKETNDMLSPPLFGQAKKKVHSLFSPEEKKQRIIEKEHRLIDQRTRTAAIRKRTGSKTKSSASDKLLVSIGKGLFFAFFSLLLFFKKVFAFLFSAVQFLFFVLTNSGGQRNYYIHNLQDTLEEKKQRIQGLPLVSKILLVVVFVSIIIFTVTIKLNTRQEVIQQETKQISQVLQAITDKKDAADASIIYGNTSKALELLKEAESLLEELPKKTDEQLAQVQELQQGLDQSIEGLRKVEKPEMQVLTTITTPNGNQLTALEKIAETFLVFDQDSELYYRVNSVTGAVEQKNQTAAKSLRAAATTKEQDRTVFLSADNALSLYTPTNQAVSSLEIGYPGQNQDIVDLAFYNRRLYSLDPINNQIYKHTQTQSGYSQGEAWLKSQGLTIDNAVSLTIDGSIYVLESTGKVQQFTKGIQDQFTLSGVDPELTGAKQIWTYSDVEELYILEPTNKRLVITNKKGQLIKQITSDEWTNPQSFSVDTTAKKIYVLDNNNIYSFGL